MAVIIHGSPHYGVQYVFGQMDKEKFMGVKIKSTQMQVQSIAESVVKVKPAQELKTQTLGELLADELIELELKLLAIDTKDIVKRQMEIKAELRKIADESVLPITSMEFQGQNGKVVVSPVSSTTKITKGQDLYEYLTAKFGPEAVYSAVSFSLTALSKLLSENELATYVEKVSGSRSVSIKPKVGV